MRRLRRLTESREVLAECSHSACPGMVQRDCSRWQDELQAQMPSVVFRVSANGEQRSNVKVFVDGQLLFETLPGRAVEMNPGTYRFRFEMEGTKPAESEIVLGEGEKFRPVTVTLQSATALEPEATPGTPPVLGPTPVAPPPEPMVQKTRPIPLATFILGGVGVVGAGSFIGWGLASTSLKSELEDKCAPTCGREESEREAMDSIKTRALIADISLGVSIASFAGAAVFYFTRPELEMPLEMQAGPLPEGGFAGSITIKGF